MSKFVRLEQVIVVNDQALHAKVPGIIAEGNYPAYHMEECTIEQYNLGEMEGILPESDG